VGPRVGRDVGEDAAVELAVVELDPALVGLDADAERRGRLRRSAQRTADDAIGSGQRGSYGTRLLLTPRRQRRIEPSEQSSLDVRCRLAVAHQQQHGRRLRLTGRSPPVCVTETAGNRRER
jgi:hypothetical protein